MAESPLSPTPLIFDRSLLRARRRRAAGRSPATFLLDRAAADLADRLAAVLRRFPLALDLGTPGDAVRAALARLGSVDTVVTANASPVTASAGAALSVAADEEAQPFRDATFDLVVSALSLQFVNDLPGTLVQIRRALKPDGLFLAALIGGETLTELRQAFAVAESEVEGGVSPHVAPFADLRDLGALLQRAGFALPVTDVDRVTVRYDFGLSVDARSAPYGRNERAGQSPSNAASARNTIAHGGNLRNPLWRRRRTHSRYVRDRLALRLGAASGSTTAAQARLGQGAARRCTRHARNFDG